MAPAGLAGPDPVARRPDPVERQSDRVGGPASGTAERSDDGPAWTPMTAKDVRDLPRARDGRDGEGVVDVVDVVGVQEFQDGRADRGRAVCARPARSATVSRDGR